MKGVLETREVQSPSLENNPLGDPARRRLTVYLPPGYAAGTQRYPVVYFLHAFGSGGGSWTNAAGFSPSVPDRLDALIEAGTIPPVIGVFPDAWTKLGGSQWVNSDAIGRYRDYLVKDIVGFVDKTFRTLPRPASRAVVGHSSGGYGALVMGRYHPEIFSLVGAHAPDSYFEYSYMPDLPKAATALMKAGGVETWVTELRQRAVATKVRGDDFPVINILAMAAAYSPKKGEPLNLELPFEQHNAKLRLDVWNRWLVHDPVRFVPKFLDAFRKLKTVYLDAGTRDEFNLRWGTRMVADDLKAGGVTVVHEEFEDGHSGVSYRFERSLSVLVPLLAAD
ncbi:alpha/beta hydrolase [Corallococcus aberystwythensis]|uniref:Alpha/beta hydrolase n=1 Tax=Corallococcus aberystwythensis TaxID=2316722 RepID=A0A3A8PF73_9BACT|nr:alpha/beta hydrolase [Corallococcus aberystwythensis]RKH54629.1 alpha/beta hydrolase [Corallococcus aberystwythensis]